MRVVFGYDPAKPSQLKQCVRPFGSARSARNPGGHGGYWTAPVAAFHAIASRFPAFARTAEVVERRTQRPDAPAEREPVQ